MAAATKHSATSRASLESCFTWSGFASSGAARATPGAGSGLISPVACWWPDSSPRRCFTSGAACLVEAAELHPRLDAALGEPAARHFQRVERRPRAAVRLLAVRLHVRDVDDRAL